MILITNIRFAGESGANSWILIDGDTIKAAGHDRDYPVSDTVVDGGGALAMPGVIDCHVHFREPGLTAKADIASESRAAIAGGVTSFLEMPNTKPATTSVDAWEWKMRKAAETSAANYAFFIGATNDNIDTLKAADYSRVPGVKMFMGSSTGNMLVDNESTITRIFEEVDAPVAVHTEDQDIIDKNTAAAIKAFGSKENVPMWMHSQIRSVEACYKSTKKAVDLAVKHNHRLHVCHVSSARELDLFSQGDPATKLITSEVSPHHLMWCDTDYDRKGARIKMNPSVKSPSSRDMLFEALNCGIIDMVATDHAPHLLSEKEGGALVAASGSPLVQFSLPWMLTNCYELTVQKAMCENPAKIYRIERRGSLKPGNYADIVLIKEVPPYTVSDADAISKCGWTPLEGETLRHRVVSTRVNGQEVFADGEFFDKKAAMPLRFAR